MREHIADDMLKQCRRHQIVTLRGRPQNRTIQALVDRVDTAICTFVRVIDQLTFLWRATTADTARAIAMAAAIPAFCLIIILVPY